MGKTDKDAATNMFSKAAINRKEELKETKKVIKTGEEKPETSGRGRKARYTEDDPKSTVTFTMTESRKEKLRTYAFKNNMTMSDILGEYVDTLEV